jgi:hypothetical protein
VTSELNNISKTAFLEGMKKLKERAKKVLIKEECILKNKNKLCPFKKLSLFYNSCLKTFGSHLVFIASFATQCSPTLATPALSPYVSG